MSQEFQKFGEFIENKKFFFSSQIVLASEFISHSEKIGYDLDQMIAESRIPVTEEVYKKRNVLYDWRTWGWGSAGKMLRNDFGLSEKDAFAEHMSYWDNADLLFKSPVVEDMKEFIGLMKLLGKEQYIITSRRPHLHESTYKWLEENGLFDLIPKTNVYLNKDVNVRGPVFKAKKCFDLGIDLFYEDCLEQVEEIIKTSPATRVIWIPAGEDIFLPRPRNERIVKIPSLSLPKLLVAQSY